MDKWNGNNRKQAHPLAETATKSTPKPGDYSLGSFESRAAARAMLKEKEQGKPVLKIHLVRKLGTAMAKKPFDIHYGPDATFEYYRDEDDCEDTE